MEKSRVERYAESLERVIQKDHRYLRETMVHFQEKCMLVTSISHVSPRVLMEIRETHREIQTRLAEIRAIQQLIRAKYFLYARKDPVRDKEISEFGFAIKAYFSKFEHTLKQMMDQAAPEEKEMPRADETDLPHRWFREEANQVMFLRNWRILNELDYEISPSRVEEKREIHRDRPRSLTLFLFKGEAGFLDDLQSCLRLREHDAIERHGTDELRGLLTHLREISPPEVERVFYRYKESHGFSKLKCLLIPIRNQEDQEKDLIAPLSRALEEMAEGEVRTLS